MASTENMTKMQKYWYGVARFYQLLNEKIDIIQEYKQKKLEVEYSSLNLYKKSNVPGIEGIAIIDKKIYILPDNEEIKSADCLPFRGFRLNKGLNRIIRDTQPTN